MSYWNEEQSKLLKKIKRDLKQQEQAQESLTRASKASSSHDASPLDELFARLASQAEGVQYRLKQQWVPAPLGNLDRLLFGLAVNIGVGPRKMAIGLPRVPVGISTWLAVSVMISRVASSRNPSTDTSPLSVHPTWILIACRERSVRDLYLSQRILFTRKPFIIDSFPIYRFKKNGEIRPISWVEPNRLSTPVLFYHFDNIDFGESGHRKAKIGLILSEISESDSRLSQTMLERLERLRTLHGNPKTYVFFNSFDNQLRGRLKSNSYEIIDIRPDATVDVNVAALPTIRGTFSHYSCPQQLSLEVVHDDYGVSQSLYECSRDLAKVNEEVRSDECRTVLANWWNLWRTLKDLAIPLETYERYRMHAQGRGSMENAISRISSSADRINSPEGKIVRAVAPTIASRLRSVYEKLAISCPKAERLLSMLNEAKSDDRRDTLYVLSQKSQVDALREYFLFTNMDLIDTQILMVHLSQAVPFARNMDVLNCILPGVWAPWQNTILVAIGAATITILMYPYEASLLKTRMREHVQECEGLTESFIEKQNYTPILILPSTQLHILDAIRESVLEKTTAVKPPEPEWLQTEPQFALDAIESEDRISEDEQLAEGLLITFDEGSSVAVRPHSEMMLVTDDGVENVFACTLSEGDVVAVMKGDVTRSIFQSVLAQVNHLVRVDHRVVDLWRSSVKKILFGGQPEWRTRSMSTIIRSLHSRGCPRTGQAIRQWFRGTTLAPKDVQDIHRVLDLAGVQRPTEISRVVSREIEVIRQFNRDLGRRIKEQIRASVTSQSQPARARIDFEIDEAIEAVEYRTVASIRTFSGDT